MSDINYEFIEGSDEYINILKRAIKYEENNPKDIGYLDKEHKTYDSCWKTVHINAHGSRIHQLEVNGFVDRVYDSSNKTKYALSDRQSIKDKLNTIKERTDQEGRRIEHHSYPDLDQLDDDLFDEVVGYDDVKWLLKRGLTTDRITNFLFLGPAGSAKSVFLLALRDAFEEAKYVVASDATSSGVIDVMFESLPKIMLIDEFDDMDKDDQSSFASYTETGILQETKYNKTREVKINTKTFAAANDKHKIKDNIIDRFTVLEFDAYTRDEYIKVCKNVLPMKEDVTQQESIEIAKAVWELNSSGDVRQAIQVARLSRGDPQKVVSTLEKYDTTTDSLSL